MKLINLIAAGLISLTGSAFAQPAVPSAPITAAEKNRTIDTLLQTLNSRYVFPEVAKQTAQFIRKQQAKKVYNALTDGNAFATQLTQDLQASSKDHHLRIEYVPDGIPEEPEHDLMSINPADRPWLTKMYRNLNYGIRKVDVLKGDVGYIDVDFFCAPEFAGEAYVGMMNYLAHTEALIIDLRRCGGSRSPEAIPFLCSYFFQDPVDLGDTYWRKGDRVTQNWTYAYVPGTRYLNKPIYVLVSRASFSGAEMLADALKFHKRATIIGQPTGGGANAGGFLRVTRHFSAFVPVGRPIGRPSWEGVGVQPDSLVHPALALNMAQHLAMQHTINTTDEAVWRDALKDWIKEIDAQKPVLKPIAFELRGYPNAKNVYVAGTFNNWVMETTPMQRKGDKWVAGSESEAGQLEYKFVVDGKWMVDPDNTRTNGSGPDANSVKVVQP
ncbi:S41 family peptidase [Mucilaginibacter koreensis]